MNHSAGNYTLNVPTNNCFAPRRLIRMKRFLRLPLLPPPPAKSPRVQLGDTQRCALRNKEGSSLAQQLGGEGSTRAHMDRARVRADGMSAHPVHTQAVCMHTPTCRGHTRSVPQDAPMDAQNWWCACTHTDHAQTQTMHTHVQTTHTCRQCTDHAHTRANHACICAAHVQPMHAHACRPCTHTVCA